MIADPLADAGALERAGQGIDTVLCLAGVTNAAAAAGADIADNIRLGMAAVRLGAALGARVLLASSAAVYGSEQGLLREDRALAPLSDYGRAKAEMEAEGARLGQVLGVAVTALAMALSGVMVFMANDSQLRDLTFWNMGSLAGATWGKLQVTGPVILLALGAAMLLARGLNALAMGEAVAAHLGIPVQRTKGAAILCTAVLTGTAVAVSGGIGFIGIIVPHLLRLATGPDHHGLLPNCALFGAALLLFADIIARIIVSPAELPIGIVTALMGTPVFLWILLRRHAAMGL